MKTAMTIAAGALLAGVAATASAQVYYERSYTYDPYPSRVEIRAGDECWNPRAGHFEEVRPGEVQNDLDFSRCRAVGGRYAERRYYRDHREYRDNGRAQECWNPRAGHFEGVRPGEIQGDLDFSRCRIARY
jgi:hypothetical protein